MELCLFRRRTMPKCACLPMCAFKNAFYFNITKCACRNWIRLAVAGALAVSACWTEEFCILFLYFLYVARSEQKITNGFARKFDFRILSVQLPPNRVDECKTYMHCVCRAPSLRISISTYIVTKNLSTTLRAHARWLQSVSDLSGCRHYPTLRMEFCSCCISAVVPL